MSSPTRVVAMVVYAMREQASTLRISRKKEPNEVRRATPPSHGTTRAAAITAAYRMSIAVEALTLPSTTPKAKANVMRSIS